MRTPIIIMGVMLAVMAGQAFALNTVVNGMVYSGDTIATPPVDGAEVTVTCEYDSQSWQLTDTTEMGYYYVEFQDPACPLGSLATVEACLGPACGGANEYVIDSNSFINILGLDIFGVPEFSAIAAGVALLGAGTVFAYLRRRHRA